MALQSGNITAPTSETHTSLREITEEYVDLRSLNPKPLKENLDCLFGIVGEKPVEAYTRQDARKFVEVYGRKVKTTSVRRRLNSLNAVFNDLPQFSGPLINRVCSPFVCPHSAA